MKLAFIAMAVGGLLSPITAFAEIKQANSFKNIQTIFAQEKGEILGMFDIDMVLVQSNNPAFQMKNMKIYKAVLTEIFASLSPLEKDVTLNLTIMNSGSNLVEKNIPKTIQKIYRTSPKLVALTASFSGALNNSQEIIDLRYQQLKKFGIDFSNSFPEFKTIIFEKIPTYFDNHPQFKHGIMSSNGEGNSINKGNITVEFLKTVNYTPDVIIFVDDRDKNLKDVEQALKDFNPNIRYVGIHYKGAEQYPSTSISKEKFTEAWMEIVKQSKMIVNQTHIQSMN